MVVLARIVCLPHRAADCTFLVTCINEAIAQQRASCERLLDSRPHRGTVLAEHVAETLGAVASRASQSEARFLAARNDLERDSALETLRLLNSFLGRMLESGDWLASATGQLVHIGGLSFIDAAASMLIGGAVDTVTVPSGADRYATLSWPYRGALGKLGATTSVSARPVVIFFPPGDADTTLLYPLYAHELGHSAVLQHNLLDQVLGTKVGTASFDAAFIAAVGDLATARGLDAATARLTLDRQMRKWLVEMICDSIASHFAGPPFAYAFACAVISESTTELQETHPPTITRVAAILADLDATQWLTEMKTETPSVIAWLEGIEAIAPAAARTYETFLVQTMVDCAPDIRSTVSALLGSSVYLPAHYARERRELRDLLQHRILPVQLDDGSAASQRCILTAGWFHLLGNRSFEGAEGDTPAGMPRGIRNGEYQLFLAKALEMSAVLDAWKAAR